MAVDYAIGQLRLMQGHLATATDGNIRGRLVSSFEGDGKQLAQIILNDGRKLSVQGAFVAIGHVPQTSFLSGAVALDAGGYVVTEKTRTSVPGVFAAGDCADPFYKQAVIAAGAGAQAAIEAQRFLQEG